MLKENPALQFAVRLPKECSICFLFPWTLGLTLLGHPTEQWEEPTVSSIKILAFAAV